MSPDLAAALDGALRHARQASEHLFAGGDDLDRDAVRDALARVDAMLGEAVSLAPNAIRLRLADGRSKVAALLLAADQLEELASGMHARRLRLRAAAVGASVASRYLRDAETSIAV